MFRFTITELKYRTLCVRKSFLSLLLQMSHLSQSVKGKMIFWHLDPVWSPAAGCLNPRVESNDSTVLLKFDPVWSPQIRSAIYIQPNAMPKLKLPRLTKWNPIIISALLLIFIFVLFNKYYCVLSKNFVTYSTATRIHLYYMLNSYDNFRQKYLKTSNFKIHMLVLLSSLCIPSILKALQVHSGPHFLTCGYQL